MNNKPIRPIAKGEIVLAVMTHPTLHLRAFEIERTWLSQAGTMRVEPKYDRTFRPGFSLDARQVIPLTAIENLPIIAR
jgi:hypothetical protein